MHPERSNGPSAPEITDVQEAAKQALREVSDQLSELADSIPNPGLEAAKEILDRESKQSFDRLRRS